MADTKNTFECKSCIDVKYKGLSRSETQKKMGHSSENMVIYYERDRHSPSRDQPLSE